jgi:acetyl/propionyl-CoA carboxylase alpha subunit
MDLEICYEGEPIGIEIASHAGQRTLLIAGREAVIDWVSLPDGRYSILVDGRVYDLTADLDGDACSVAGRQGKFILQIKDPRRLDSARIAEEVQAGLQRLNAEMPGKVIRVLVQEGDAVVYDQGLLVIEAMKMQNEIRAPKAGTIKAVGVSAGRTVNTGDFLLSLE